MQRFILRICCLLLTISSIGIITPQTVHASGDLERKSLCLLNSSLVMWGGGSAIHANGLLYVAKSISPYSSLSTKSYTAIYAIDPETAGTANNSGTSICNVVAVYNDSSDNYTAYSVLLNPSVLVSDSQGNIYTGRGSKKFFRMLYIPASATTTAPFAGLTARNIVYDVNKGAYTFSGLAVTDDHAVITMSGWNAGEEFDVRFAVLTTNQIKNHSSTIINDASWQSFGIGSGVLDSFVGMPNGKFFLSAGLKRSGTLVVGAAFLDPVTNALTKAFNPTVGGVDIIDCRPASGLTFTQIFGCNSPSAAMGADDNLYFTVHLIERGGPKRGNVAWRYIVATGEWKGLGNLPKPTLISLLNDFEAYGGVEITADADGNVMAAMNGEFNKKATNLAFLRNGVWSLGNPNFKYVAFGRPNIEVITVGGEPRVSLMYVIGVGSTNYLWWATYKAPVNAVSSRCKANVVLEGGSYYVNKTPISGTIYTGATCSATRYLAVASASATPPATPNTSDIKLFSQENGNFSVSGLVAGLNYVHVRLYDQTNALESWATNSVYLDTDNTVGATVTLNNGNGIPSFKDTWSMRAASYTANGYTRSTIGTISITGITDPSGLASYAINDQPAVNFDGNLVNQPIPVNFNGITNTVGISLTLTDGAGNTEVRGIRPLVIDVTPPTIASSPTATFTAATGVFSGTLSLNGGTISDDIYLDSGRQYWGVWVANARCVGDVVGGCPTDTDGQLRWGTVPVTDPSLISWNLLHGLNQVPSSGLYRTYVRILDGAGNASTTAVTVDTTVTIAPNQIYLPLNFSQR